MVEIKKEAFAKCSQLVCLCIPIFDCIKNSQFHYYQITLSTASSLCLLSVSPVTMMPQQSPVPGDVAAEVTTRDPLALS